MEGRLRNKIRVTLHLVWTTRKRLPLLRPEWENRVFRCMAAQVTKLGGKVLAINGMPDHIHLLVAIAPTVSISQLAKQVKGASSAFIRDELADDSHFAWAEGYGVFSVSPSHRPRVIACIRNQKRHHAARTLWPDTEEPREAEPVPEGRPGSPAARSPPRL